MRIGSLFSGVGQLDMAVEQVFGATTAWHCELYSAASKVLAHHWPGVPNHHDITTVDSAAVEPVDIIAAGWPCQPFSLAGKRKGADDERALWPYVAGAVRMVRPRIVVLENVSAVLGPEFQRVANDLAACGYDIAWTCLRASDVGAPHRRERLFALATHTPRNGRHEGRPEPEGLIGGSDAAVGGAGPVELLPTPMAHDAKGTGPSGFSRNTPELARIDHYFPTPTASDATGGGCHPDARVGHTAQIIDVALLHGSPRWGKYEPAIRRWESLTRPAPSPTEPNTKGNPRLSAAFSEWMMGWPAGWVTDVPGISRNDALRCIGNGVVPQCAEAALRWLLSVCEVAA